MKKTLTLSIAVLALITFATQGFAATASLVSSQATIPAGKTFTVSVSIDPQGTTNYAEKLEVKFPADVLEVRSFTFANSWMALSQPGYDVTDNANGTLIKSAGYASGFSTPTQYGTITFFTKKAGAGTISVGSNSAAFNATGQTQLTGQVLAVTIGSTPVVTPVATPTVVSTPEATVSTQATPESIVTVPASTDLAAVIATEETGMSNLSISLIILVVLVVVAIGVGFYYFTPKKRTKSRRI